MSYKFCRLVCNKNSLDLVGLSQTYDFNWSIGNIGDAQIFYSDGTHGRETKSMWNILDGVVVAIAYINDNSCMALHSLHYYCGLDIVELLQH